jgi:hypothetical protein
MQIATGTVIDGKIVLEGVPLSEGARLTVVTRGADEGSVLTTAQEDALLESISQIERGECLSLDEVLASLPTSSRWLSLSKSALGRRRPRFSLG